ncbi:MAG: membrane protein of unknown function [Promethearchaeota archaeon]|nr:MAG: membrane protein of unknown function [Candidatus Lokiarchaeota archaeon]
MIIGLFFSILSIPLLYLNDNHLNNAQFVEFEDPNGDKLKGKYYPGSKEGGVILLEGFSSDQTALKPIASEFSKIGLHVFSFDFSGQGKSPGALGFDNAETDRLAKQVTSALEIFMSVSGLNESDILFLGHSMGARVGLQASLIGNLNISGLILLGVQINLLENVQSSFFTGVSDTTLEWVQDLDYNTPPVDILIITSTLDDVLTPQSADALIDKLNGNSSSYKRELIVTEGIFHNYEIYSPKIISKALNWGVINLNLDSSANYKATITVQRNLLWILFASAMFLFAVSGNVYFSTESEETERDKHNFSLVKIENSRKYFIMKLLLWIAALPVALLTFLVLFLIPIGLPIFALIYVGFIGSYGLLLLLLYWKGKTPATKGEFKFNIPDKVEPKKNQIIAIGLILLIIVLITLFFNSGFYYLYALNGRFTWLIILTILTIPGFFIGQIETIFIRNSLRKNKIYLFINTLIGLVPFFLFTLLFLALGSTSGMISGLHGLIILSFIIISGNLIKKIGKTISITVVYQAFLIQYLILPQTALFFIF